MKRVTFWDVCDLPEFHMMDGERPPHWYISDGASCAPDVVCGIDIRPAAFFHDFAYERKWPAGNNERARYVADRQLFVNLRRCGMPCWLARLFYMRVRLFGTFHFEYDHPPKRTLRWWLNLAIGRYWQW